MNAEETLSRLGLELPPAPQPVANYKTSLQVGNLLYLSGHGPAPGEGIRTTGKLGKDLSTEEGYRAARQTGLSLLATVRAALGSLDRVERVVKLLGLVNSASDFVDQPKVINGCSDLMVEVFGDPGRGTRSAVGCNALPGDIATEVEAIFLVQE